MRNIIIVCFLFFQTFSFAQVNGNGNIVTRTFDLGMLRKLEINITADIIIDTKAKAGISITTDENLIDYIAIKPNGGYLDLTQLEWIESSKGHKIVIGAPDLEKVISDAHSNTVVKNLNVERFNAVANVGKVYLEGTTKYLKLKVKTGSINATKIATQTADVTIKSWGRVALGKVENLRTDIDNDGSLTVDGKPKTMSGNAAEALNNPKQPINTDDIQYINFKIKNNSWKRNQFYVIGPKKDGSYFSYGLALFPGQTRKERWTTGTKVYKVGALGKRKLLVTIEAEDEDSMVKLFQKD